MSRESVQAFFEANAPDIEPVVLTDSTATVAEAAQALGVEEGQIAKTLALKVGDERILVVMAGTGRLDNRKTKDTFGNRPRMLPADEVLELTSHPVGALGCRSRSGCSVTFRCVRLTKSGPQQVIGTVSYV